MNQVGNILAKDIRFDKSIIRGEFIEHTVCVAINNVSVKS